jgi:DNA-binding response OmpR family regulator
MTEIPHVKLLLVEDDEDDYIITQGLIADLKGRVFTLDWVRTYEAGLRAMTENRHDVCLLDYRLGAHDGLELMSKAIAGGCQSPIILLTGMGEHEVDVAAMKAGAADYLVKSGLNASQLERSIRYAIERKRAAAQAAFDQARLSAFGADVGLALTGSATLPEMLTNCAKAMVQYLNASLAQVWVYHAPQKQLRPVAAFGPALTGAGQCHLSEGSARRPDRGRSGMGGAPQSRFLRGAAPAAGGSFRRVDVTFFRPAAGGNHPAGTGLGGARRRPGHRPQTIQRGAHRQRRQVSRGGGIHSRGHFPDG